MSISVVHGAFCSINVNVTGDVLGVYTNTTGAISSTDSGTGSPSNTATLMVAARIFQPLILR